MSVQLLSGNRRIDREISHVFFFLLSRLRIRTRRRRRRRLLIILEIRDSIRVTSEGDFFSDQVRFAFFRPYRWPDG